MFSAHSEHNKSNVKCRADMPTGWVGGWVLDGRRQRERIMG